ncbi:MAG: 1,6-anhydro-N-acetylmuramyl-L-alanine amidase AmpD [Betaproteobacteria bacterium]
MTGGDRNYQAESHVDGEGWLKEGRCVASPNFDQRPAGTAISLVVIHAISLPPSRFGSDDILRFFTNTLVPEAHPFFSEIVHLRVSAHFLIRRDGELIQFVSCHERAWHAGESSWCGRERCNDFSIGIELEGCDDQPFEESQYRCLSDLIQFLCTCYPIDAVVGHSDIAPSRKTDPGPCFEWARIQGCVCDGAQVR